MTFKEWRVRRKTARNLKEAMHAMTLNSIGKLYGCTRVKGESNRSFERRILRTHMSSDRLWYVNDAKINVEVTEHE